MAIGNKSALFDHGDKEECLKGDARGVSRPQGDGCDIGAFELKNIVKDEDEDEDEDQDKDGILDIEEGAGPNDGDINGDGILDVEQASVSTYKNDIVQGYVAVELVGGECTKNIQVRSYKEADLPDQDPDYEYTLGLHGSDIVCGVKGGTATVIYYWDKEYDTSQWQYRKYVENKHAYIDFSRQVTYGVAEVDGKKVTTVTFKLTDGGEYDSDGIVNGVIVDPAGPVMKKDVQGNSSIGNTVWLDANNNGKQDNDEKGLENIRVKLIWYGPDGEYDHGKKDDIVLRTDTNHNGHYIFENLPKGKYKVVVKKEDVAQYIQTYDPDSKMNGKDTVHLRKGQNYTKGDFGYSNREFELAKTGGDLWVWLIIMLGLDGLYIIRKKVRWKN
jgi:hypothetical protein